MNQEETPLTLQDIKTLESLFIVEMHSAERIFRLIETGMETIYRESKDYKALVKKHGKPAADQIVRHYTHQVLTQDEQYNIGQLLKVCKTLHHYMDRLTIAGIEMQPGTKDKGRKEAEMFDALQHDGKLLAWRHGMMCNISPADDLKLDSTLKALAKDHLVSDRIIEELKTGLEPEQDINRRKAHY